MKKRLMSTLMALACAGAMQLPAAGTVAPNPKYIFFFLGDGMANSQIQATEAYLTTILGGAATNPHHMLSNRLTMCTAPVVGMQTTFDDGALITDSASAATAFACGTKTMSGVIGMNTARTESYLSVAHAAAAYGKKVGILTSVSLDHATPAAYYASVPSRNFMNNIAYQLTRSGFNFFGGGGFASPTRAKTTGDTAYNIWNELTAMGYTVCTNRASIMSLTNAPADKMVCINPWLQDSAAMPYDIDRPASNVSLEEMTEVAIACLQDDPEGFFIMVEGGKIDWSCHANDAMATIGDMLDFDAAIAVAARFAEAHPGETLVVATGDHETGGMAVGHAGLGYAVNYTVLTNQKCSFQYFGANQWSTYKRAHTNGFDPVLHNIADEADGEAQQLLADCFGLVWANLDAYQKQRLEAAYDKSIGNYSANSSQEDALLYGGYEPMVVTITHIVNERAGIGWTSYAHTGVPVPVFACGVHAWQFSGFYDNTDIAKRLAWIMGYRGSLPVLK